MERRQWCASDRADDTEGIMIERRYVGIRDGDWPREWRFYVGHKWTGQRAQQSVDRLNRQAPRSWEYRWRPAFTVTKAGPDLYADFNPQTKGGQEGAQSQNDDIGKVLEK